MLSPAQLDARRGKLTASRIACLMTGDAEKIMRLYREMIGEEQPEDLDQVWAVRLGICTEQLQLDWREGQDGCAVVRRGDVVQHPRYPWAACTLDGWLTDLNCPIEAKHCSGREPLEVLIERYQPQMQWQMECTGASQCALSVILGAREPVVEFIPADAEYQFEMVTRGAIFMRCVAERRPPVALEPVPAPVDASAIYDMAQTPKANEWASYAASWLQSREAAEQCREAEKVLKSLVPADAKKCSAFGVQITRDRAGRLSLRELAS